MSTRLVLAGVVAAVAVAAVPAAASAGTATGTAYQVTGTEIAFTSTEGDFVGYALGTDGSAGVFEADVVHQPLGSSTTPQPASRGVRRWSSSDGPSATGRWPGPWTASLMRCVTWVSTGATEWP